jgi:hypothetical protein
MNASSRSILLIAFLMMNVILHSCQKEDAAMNKTVQLNAESASGNNSGSYVLDVVANQSPTYWSDQMIANVTDLNNIYINSFDSVRWAGQNGATGYYCATDCSGLLTALLKQSYGYTTTYFKKWTGYSNPYASSYYNEIVTQDHFTRINSVTQIQRGDIVAMKYPAGSSNTGHVMVVAASPVVRASTNPLVTGTTQYEVLIMDCSSSGHGSNDTRYINGTDWYDGIGRGIFRLYVNSSGSIVGYTWSTYSSSVYYSQTQRQLAVGRLIP